MGLEKISEYKKLLGLTNEELSKLSGVPKGTLDKILSGVTKDPKLGTLKALARVFNCTLDDFDDLDTLDNSAPLSNEENTLLTNFSKLNDLGKNEANKRVAELTEIAKYSYTHETNHNDESYIPTTFAAHDDSDPEIAKHDADVARKFLAKIKKK